MYKKKRNYAGDFCFDMSPELELYSIVCTSALQPTYYVPSVNDQLENIRRLVGKVDPLFTAKLAIYARERMYLRKIPLILTAELCKVCHDNHYYGIIRPLVFRVVQRADEMSELVECYLKTNEIDSKRVEKKGNHTIEKRIFKLSNAIRRGLKDIFEANKFDAYQYAKYSKGNGNIALRDIMFLTHPKPQNRSQAALFEEIADDMLETPYTWEVELSKAGQEGKSKKAVWEQLIESGRLGYMAMLRNLRNFLKEGLSKDHIERVAEILANPEKVIKSRQLPFRYLSAYRALGYGPRHRVTWGDYDWSEKEEPTKSSLILADALEKAVNVSIQNVPMFENERVLNAIDVSGSMQCTISPRSEIQNYDIGTLLAMLLQSRCNHITNGMFGDDWKVLDDLPTDYILRATNQIHEREGEVGYSTNGWKVLKYANDCNEEYDRIMMFTDCELWSTSKDGQVNKEWDRYRSKYPETKLYLFNLASYGNSPLKMIDNNVYLISGWSDSIFSVLRNIENGGTSLDEIKEILL